MKSTVLTLSMPREFLMIRLFLGLILGKTMARCECTASDVSTMLWSLPSFIRIEMARPGLFRRDVLIEMKGDCMKKPYTRPLTTEELLALGDDEIDYSDIPPLGEEFWKNAKLVMPEKTEQITLRVKSTVLEAYKATGKGYQTRMNSVLESYARTLKT
jgi:uncharacterized protein (DUF4415 family)